MSKSIGPRPAEVTCACGVIMEVGKRGRVPQSCPRCSAHRYYVTKTQATTAARSLIFPAICTKCSRYYIARKLPSKWCGECRLEAERHRKRESIARDRKRAGRNQFAGNLRRYNLTIEQYDAMLAAQDGRCAICGTDDPAPKSRFCVDHDHSCCLGIKSCGQCVRSLLCDSCNRMIAADDPARLRAAAAYIESHRRS